jgi:microcystin-dependent protein
MSEPFLAEVRIVGFNFAPRGWASCDGQILPISQNQSLFALLGTIYGGDGRTTFALPELRGRTPLHPGTSTAPGAVNHSQGQRSGEENHALTTSEMPDHDHSVAANTAPATSDEPQGNLPARAAFDAYGGATALGAFGADTGAATVRDTGGGQGHDNMQPWLAVNFCIALQGIFPSRN